MPWKVSDVEKERARFVTEWESEDWDLSELCRQTHLGMLILVTKWPGQPTDSASDYITFDLCKPDLHLIQP